MKYLVGSRALLINRPDSDYDMHNCKKGPENTHTIKFMKSIDGHKVDLHEFIFENKKVLLEAIRGNSVQALLYKEFREYWKIKDQEAIDLIEQYRSELRPYEDLYYRRKLLKERISHIQVKEAYDEYQKTKKGGAE